MEWVYLSLDMGVATCAGLAVLWVLIVGPTLQTEVGKNPQTAMQLFIALSYPTGDLLVLWASIALIASGRIHGMILSTRMLAAAGAILVFADTVYGYQLLENTYENGNWLGIFWSGSLGLIGLQGWPAQTVHAGTSLVTTDRAPITAPSPIVIPGWTKHSAANQA